MQPAQPSPAGPPLRRIRRVPLEVLGLRVSLSDRIKKRLYRNSVLHSSLFLYLKRLHKPIKIIANLYIKGATGKIETDIPCLTQYNKNKKYK